MTTNDAAVSAYQRGDVRTGDPGLDRVTEQLSASEIGKRFRQPTGAYGYFEGTVRNAYNEELLQQMLLSFAATLSEAQQQPRDDASWSWTRATVNDLDSADRLYLRLG